MAVAAEVLLLLVTKRTETQGTLGLQTKHFLYVVGLQRKRMGLLFPKISETRYFLCVTIVDTCFILS